MKIQVRYGETNYGEINSNSCDSLSSILHEKYIDDEYYSNDLGVLEIYDHDLNDHKLNKHKLNDNIVTTWTYIKDYNIYQSMNMDTFTKIIRVEKYECVGCYNFFDVEPGINKYCIQCRGQMTKAKINDNEKNDNRICPCNKGYMNKCYFFTQCGKYTGHCDTCKINWIQEYCDRCR